MGERVSELPGCMAHVASDEEALKNIHTAIHLWLDSAREDGAPILEPHPG